VGKKIATISEAANVDDEDRDLSMDESDYGDAEGYDGEDDDEAELDVLDQVKRSARMRAENAERRRMKDMIEKREMVKERGENRQKREREEGEKGDGEQHSPRRRGGGRSRWRGREAYRGRLSGGGVGGIDNDYSNCGAKEGEVVDSAEVVAGRIDGWMYFLYLFTFLVFISVCFFSFFTSLLFLRVMV
jgi:hypothetical protein